MKTVLLSLALLALTELGESVPLNLEDTAVKGRLIVRVTGPQRGTDRGQGALALYNSAESFARREPLATAVTEVVDGVSEWVIEDLPAGNYAVAFYLDRNGNGRLDRNKLGIPREPYGFSRNARAPFGPPAFEEASFRFGGGNAGIEFEAR